MKENKLSENREEDRVFGFTAEGGWRLVITFLRRYEVFGVVVKSEKLDQGKDLWIDLDDIKNYFISKSDYG